MPLDLKNAIAETFARPQVQLWVPLSSTPCSGRQSHLHPMGCLSYTALSSGMPMPSTPGETSRLSSLIDEYVELALCTNPISAMRRAFQRVRLELSTIMHLYLLCSFTTMIH